MANSEHLYIVKQGSVAWNKWIAENPEVEADLSDQNLSDLDLTNTHFEGANLTGTILRRTRLAGANLTRAVLKNALATGATFDQANLEGADFSGVDLSRASLDGAKITGTVFRRAILDGTNFEGVNFKAANLARVHLERANLKGANLGHSILVRADLKRANLKGAILSHSMLRDADLSDADLGSANLISADLAGADLRSAILNNSTLSNADLQLAKLSGAMLRGATLRGATLNLANLSDADLGSANLISANLASAILRGADLSDTKISSTVIANVDLSEVRGLDTVIHLGPSTIGLDTLYKSAGKISEFFLRGCGLSDWEIESAKLYNPDLSNEEINNIQYRIHELRARRAFQISPLFISYSHADAAFVDAIEDLLVEQGIRFWRDVHHAVAGRLERQIDQAIHLNDVVLLVLSKQSTNSDWVEHEVRKARGKEKKSGKDVLCPVALDDSWKTCRWPERLREQIEEYNILDFSNWQDDAHFQKIFGKLLEGLNLFYK